MLKNMRLPALIVVVAIVALLLPGPATLALTPEPPRLTGTTSFYTGPGQQLRYGAKGDPKTGMVTFVARLTNDTSDTIRRVGLRLKVPDGTYLLESWCSLPGSNAGNGPNAEGFVEWPLLRNVRAPEGSTAVCGITVGGWDGKSVIVSGARAYWAANKPFIGATGPGNPGTGINTWWDSDGYHSDAAATIKYPFDADGFVNVIGTADKFDVPTKATFQALEKRVKALEDLVK